MYIPRSTIYWHGNRGNHTRLFKRLASISFLFMYMHILVACRSRGGWRVHRTVNVQQHVLDAFLRGFSHQAIALCHTCPLLNADHQIVAPIQQVDFSGRRNAAGCDTLDRRYTGRNLCIVIHSCFLILQEAVVGIQYTPQDLQGPAHTLGNPGGKMICAWSVFFYLGTRNKTTLLRVIPSMVHDMSRRKSRHIFYIFWHSIWHICWQSIWNIFWHSIWRSVWHIFWHSIWHSIWDILTLALCLTYNYINTGILSDILSGILSDIYIYWHSTWYSIWHIFWHSIWHIFCCCCCCCWSNPICFGQIHNFFGSFPCLNPMFWSKLSNSPVGFPSPTDLSIPTLSRKARSHSTSALRDSAFKSCRWNTWRNQRWLGVQLRLQKGITMVITSYNIL